MNKLLILILFLSAISFNGVEISAQSFIQCPKSGELVKVPAKDKTEFLDALKKLVPKIYEQGDYAEMYTEWEVKAAVPFPNTVNNKKNEVYYEMAKNFCGKEVADKSWLARFYFPKWEGKSASALEGQIFAAKSKEKGWFVWFRYH
ncbi:hypothetical protein [Virgibacillus oceani]|uniref:Uncharacterized protein n=1 Tax=Virgibacillus oceani TaxID=1479511 RepID=A0A917HIV5_9BACI|nr:hypothetical protein [Virgibacillus oceani]GGG80756.1 hypothetical protein GCM10011398_27710 [Virgibacillus oceani]